MSNEARPNRALLVGSVPLANNEAVFRAASRHLGQFLKRMPDGETGPRINWIEWQFPMLNQNPAFETVTATDVPRPDCGPRLRLKRDIDPAGIFGPLGYAKAAADSYAVFADLQSQGVVPPDVKFQVSLPTPFAVLFGRFEPDSFPAVEPAYERALSNEISTMLNAIPAERLAIQWDVAVEIIRLENEKQKPGSAPFPGFEAATLQRLVRLGEAVPAGVELGYHLCYGDRDHRHSIEPSDLEICVSVSNSLAKGVSRSIEWVHMPVPHDRQDAAYFQPLEELRPRPATEVYLGLVHYRDGAAGTRERIKVAQGFIDGFGVATECGLGRRPSETIDALLRIHAAVMD